MRTATIIYFDLAMDLTGLLEKNNIISKQTQRFSVLVSRSLCSDDEHCRYARLL